MYFIIYLLIYNINISILILYLYVNVYLFYIIYLQYICLSLIFNCIFNACHTWHINK